MKSRKTKVPGIVLLDDGTFLVRARWTDRRTGRRRKREGIASTLTDAVSLQAGLTEEATMSTTAKPSRQRFGDYVEHCLRVYGERLTRSALERYVIESGHWVARFGDVYVDALTAADVRAAQGTMCRRAKPTTVNGRLRILRRILDDALTDGLVGENVARRIKMLPEGKTQGRRAAALAVDEFRRFVDSVDALMMEKDRRKRIAPDIGRLILFLAWTGCRRGEALALRFSDIADGEIHVSRSVWRLFEKSVKTGDPRRVAIVLPLAMVIEEQRRWLIENQHPALKTGLVFPANPKQKAAARKRRGDNDDLHEEAWFRAGSCLAGPLLKVAKVAKVAEFSPHALRRTAENLARRAGVDQLVRRAQQGWRTATAQALYAEVSAEERAAAGAAVVQLVLGAAMPTEVRPSGTPEVADVDAAEG